MRLTWPIRRKKMSEQTENASTENNTTTEATQTQESTSTQNQDTQESTQENSTSKGIIEEALSTTDVNEEDKPAEETTPPVEETSQESYELHLEEDSPLTDAEFDEIVAEAERLKLSKEDAEKLIKMREYSHKASQEVFLKANQDRINKMVAEYDADAELKTPESRQAMRTAIGAYGNSPAFKEMMQKHPELNYNVPLAKFIVEVGKNLNAGQNTLPMGKGSNFTTPGEADEVTRAANNLFKDMM